MVKIQLFICPDCEYDRKTSFSSRVSTVLVCIIVGYTKFRLCWYYYPFNVTKTVIALIKSRLGRD